MYMDIKLSIIEWAASQRLHPKKTDSLSCNSHKVSIALQPGQRLCEPSLIHGGILANLIFVQALYLPFACRHGPCESMCAMALLYLGNTVSQQSSTTSGSYTLSPLQIIIEPEKKGVQLYMSHLGLSMPQSFIYCTFISCESLY